MSFEFAGVTLVLGISELGRTSAMITCLSMCAFGAIAQGVDLVGKELLEMRARREERA
jgi:hypothetical protein